MQVKMDQKFNNLLTYLCPEDPDEAGRRYERLRQKLTGFFRFRGVADPTAAADEALDRAASRIADATDVPDVETICLRIARLMMVEDSRHNTKESTAFLQFLEQRESANAQIDRFTLMKTCFEKLAQDDRELLDWYCVAPPGLARVKYHVDLAQRLDITVPALRVHVTRLRQGLDDSVKELSKSYW